MGGVLEHLQAASASPPTHDSLTRPAHRSQRTHARAHTHLWLLLPGRAVGCHGPPLRLARLLLVAPPQRHLIILPQDVKVCTSMGGWVGGWVWGPRGWVGEERGRGKGITR